MMSNFFRGLLGEGAMNAAFLPVFTEYASDPLKRKEGFEIFNICFTFSLLATVALFLLALSVSFISTGLLSETSRWWKTWILLRFTFPYLIFISLTALNMGVLNAHKSFMLPSLSPVILDIVWIAALFLFIPFFGSTPDDQIFVLCFAVIAGGIGQFIFTLIPVLKKGYKVKLDFRFTKHPAIKKIGKLLTPIMIGFAIGPINILVGNIIAKVLYEGAVAGLKYSTMIFQLPLGVFAISISTAVLPWFSEDISSTNYAGFIKNLKLSLKMLAILLLPFTFGLIIFRTEIVSFLFERGMFDIESVSMTDLPLAFYSLGLFGYGGASRYGPGHFTHCKDTATPVKVGIFSIAVNFILSIVLIKFIGHSGIALASSAVGIINFIMLAVIFNKKHIYFNFREILPFITKTLIASEVMVVAIYFYKNAVESVFSLPVILFTGIIMAVLVYLICLKWLKVLTPRHLSLRKD